LTYIEDLDNMYHNTETEATVSYIGV